MTDRQKEIVTYLKLLAEAWEVDDYPPPKLRGMAEDGDKYRKWQDDYTARLKERPRLEVRSEFHPVYDRIGDEMSSKEVFRAVFQIDTDIPFSSAYVLHGDALQPLKERFHGLGVMIDYCDEQEFTYWIKKPPAGGDLRLTVVIPDL